MLVFNGANLPPPLYVIYRERLHFTEIPLTLVFASHVVGAVTGLVFFERLSDQVGRRPVLFAALARRR
jgi:MFS family permease